MPLHIMTPNIEQVVINQIARHKGLDSTKIEPGLELTSLGVSSLDAITLAYEFEETFGVEIPNSDIESLQTVQDLVDALSRLTAAKR